MHKQVKENSRLAATSRAASNGVSSWAGPQPPGRRLPGPQSVQESRALPLPHSAGGSQMHSGSRACPRLGEQRERHQDRPQPKASLWSVARREGWRARPLSPRKAVFTGREVRSVGSASSGSAGAQGCRGWLWPWGRAQGACGGHSSCSGPSPACGAAPA